MRDYDPTYENCDICSLSADRDKASDDGWLPALLYYDSDGDLQEIGPICNHCLAFITISHDEAHDEYFPDHINLAELVLRAKDRTVARLIAGIAKALDEFHAHEKKENF